MKYIIPLLIYILPLHLFSQNKHDYNWLSGYHRVGLNPPGTLLDFNAVPVDIKPSALLGGLTDATVMSDSSGRLLFYSDGCMVMNANHTMMTDGDSINAPGPNFLSACIYDSTGYSGLWQGIISLPYPGHPELYVIFHLRHPESSWGPDNLHYTLVDMSAENGLGRVVKKNEFLMQGKFADCLTAIRHGNGRDWWLVAAEGDDTYNLFLLSPSGITGPFVQQGGYTTRAFDRIGNQAVFSPDGTRYARIGLGHILQMEFDRCSGRFSCPRFLEIDSNSKIGGGIAYSPDSRLLYVTFNTELFQFRSEDMRTNSAKPLLIDTYDGFSSIIPTTFFRMQLAPDQKIYMCCTNGTYWLHRINNPNEEGVACNFQQHSIHLPTPNAISLNNFPVFRLYDQPHSICDTLGIDAPPGIAPAPGWVPEQGVKVYPSPATDWVYIAVAACDYGRLRVVNAEGQVLYEIKDWKGPQSIELPVAEWPSGMYFVQLHRHNQYRHIQYVEKFVVMH